MPNEQQEHSMCNCKRHLLIPVKIGRLWPCPANQSVQYVPESCSLSPKTPIGLAHDRRLRVNFTSTWAMIVGCSCTPNIWPCRVLPLDFIRNLQWCRQKWTWCVHVAVATKNCMMVIIPQPILLNRVEVLFYLCNVNLVCSFVTLCMYYKVLLAAACC